MVNSLYKEVIFSPPDAEPFIAYLSISLDFRTLAQIIAAYEQNVPDAIGEDVNFYGVPGLRYTYPTGRHEYIIPYQGKIFLIATDRPNHSTVQSILMSIQFLSSSVDIEVGPADNGKTITMHVGDRLLLNIGSDTYDWSVAVDDETVLSLEQNVALTGGTLGVYRANRPGSTSLTASGNPKCFNSVPPCLLPSMMFGITVVVE